MVCGLRLKISQSVLTVEHVGDENESLDANYGCTSPAMPTLSSRQVVQRPADDASGLSELRPEAGTRAGILPGFRVCELCGDRDDDNDSILAVRLRIWSQQRCRALDLYHLRRRFSPLVLSVCQKHLAVADVPGEFKRFHGVL